MMKFAVKNLTVFVLTLTVICVNNIAGLSGSYQDNSSLYSVPCNEGWFLYGEKCYGIMGQGNELTWKQALDICMLEHVDQSGYLATINSKDLQEFLTAFLLLNAQSNLWIGLHDREAEASYMWTDGSSVNYTFWDPQEPSGSRNHKEDCVEMRIKAKGEIGMWNDIDCQSKLPYLCQADKDTNISSSDPRYCSLEDNRGWKYLNSCYHVVQETLTWEEAEYYCQEHYRGHLSKILNPKAETFINYILSNQSTDFWIGIKIKNQDLQRWSSGWNAVYTRWDDEHKNFLNGTCALVTTKKTWSSAPCFKQYPFICETSKDSSLLKQAPKGWICPPASNDWIDLGGDSCYYFETEKEAHWFEANFHCIKKGGTLASIHSIVESDLLHFYVINTKERLLIGLHRNLSNKKVFEWADGSELDYVNWKENEPNNENEGCGELWTETMKWNDVPCNVPKGFICSAKKVPSKSNQTIVSALRNGTKQEVSRIKRDISLKTVIGISSAVLVFSFVICFTIRYYMQSCTPSFRSKRHTASTEELNTRAMECSKL